MCARACAAGAASGEAHVVSRLQLDLCEVAAVQPRSSSSRSGAEAAERPLQRPPHPGLRLGASLHAGTGSCSVWVRMQRDGEQLHRQEPCLIT